MPTEFKGGRARTRRTYDEEISELKKQWNSFSETEKEFLTRVIKGEEGAEEVFRSLLESHYERTPVSIDEFLDNEYYSGPGGSDVYDKIRGDLREIFGGRYSEMIMTGCVSLDEPVMLADGSLVDLGDLVADGDGVEVVTSDGTVEGASPSYSGVQGVVRVTLDNGMSVKLTPDHLVECWGFEGREWVPAGDLEPGKHRVATPRRWDTQPSASVDPDTAMLVGYWQGDGSSSSSRRRARFCDGRRACCERVVDLLQGEGFDGNLVPKKGTNAWIIRVRKFITSGFRDFLDGYGILDEKTGEETVPESIAASPDETVSAYLRGLWDCEGYVYVPDEGKASVGLGMSSVTYLREIQLLLLRFGVHARLQRVDYETGGDGGILTVTGVDEMTRFLDTIGPLPSKAEECDALRAYCESREGNTNVDTMPFTWGDLNDWMVGRIERERGDEWWHLGQKRDREVSREKWEAWKRRYGDRDCADDLVDRFEENHVYATVEDVESVALEMHVGDLSVPDENRFVSSGLGVHNSIGWGKSVHPDTEVYDATNKRRRRIDEPVNYETLTLADRTDLETRPSRPRPTGRKRCAEVTLASGTSFTASFDHRVLTNHGWCDVGSLLEGRTLVATPREIPEPDEPRELPDAEVKLLAMLLGDGGLTHRVKFTNQDPEILDEYARCALEVTPDENPTTNAREYADRSPNTFDVTIGGITEWAKRWGIHGDKSVDKRVPAELYGLSDDQIALFLRWLWACDGSVYTGSPRKVELQLASEKFVDDVRWMLKRLGVHSRKVARESADGEFDSWRVAITGVGPMQRFLEVVGPIPGKREACGELLEHCRSTEANPNDDVVPFGWYDFCDEMGRKGEPVPKEWKRPVGQRMTRKGFEAYVEQTGYDGRHARHAESDVYWDRVVDVEPVGMKPVYDMSVEGTRNFVGDGVILHNSYSAAYALMYSIYRVTCLRNPQQTFNLADGSDIYFILMSVTAQQAKLSLYSDLTTKIESSQYFQDIGVECLTDKARFPKNIYLLPCATTSRNVLSLNVFGGIVDEANFGQNRKRVKNSMNASGAPPTRVEKNYKKILTRMKSRFMVKGALPGVLVLVSSKNTDHDFTAKRIANTREDSSTYVMDYAEWETKPEEKYSGETFRVFFGGRSAKSRILEEGEDPPPVDDENARVLEIPVEFRPDFEDGLVESIRDIAGVSVPEVTPFIHRTETIPAMAQDRPDDPPLSTTEWTCGSGTPFKWHELCDKVDDEVIRGVTETSWQPKVNPDTARHIHIDPSLSDDATGFCMGHVERYVDVVMRDPDTGDKYKETRPLVYVDVIFRVKPPENGEIRYRHVRRLIYELSRHGFYVPYVSMDSYNSADTLQQLSEQGYQTEVRSLDENIDGYSTLKSAMYQERVRCYEYGALEHELRRLKRLDQEEKVDHPEGGSKDLADALAGVVWSLDEERHDLMDIPDDKPTPPQSGDPREQWEDAPGAAGTRGTPAGDGFGGGGSGNAGGGGTLNPFD